MLPPVVHGASGSSSAPAPNARRQPAGGHPGSTQRVQRLRRYSVAGIGRGDGVAARASGFCGRAASPFGIACTWRGRPPWDSVAALPVSSGPSPADVAVAVCSSGIAFFLCRGRKKREVLSIQHNNPYRGGVASAGYSPRYGLLYLIPVPTSALPPVVRAAVISQFLAPTPGVEASPSGFAGLYAPCGACLCAPPAVRPSLGVCPRSGQYLSHRLRRTMPGSLHTSLHTHRVVIGYP